MQVRKVTKLTQRSCRRHNSDPFKDTSGPSLNLLIKLMSIVSVVIAGLLLIKASVLDCAPVAWP